MNLYVITQHNIYIFISESALGIPGWLSGLAPAFGPGRDPGVLGSNPSSGFLLLLLPVSLPLMNK